MRNQYGMRILALAVALLAGGGVGAEETGKWVAESGHAIVLPEGANAMVISEGGETFDLANLRDGESRTFGQGEKQVTSTRLGDLVTIARTAGEGKPLEVQCLVGQDLCQVTTFADQPEKVMIMIQKTRECVHGTGDCDKTMDITAQALPHGAHAIVHKVKCDDAGNCEKFEDISHHGIRIIADVEGDPGNANVIILDSAAPGAGVLLRCPQGDATVKVSAEEAGDTFLCPKHSVPMEQAAGGMILGKPRTKTR